MQHLALIVGAHLSSLEPLLRFFDFHAVQFTLVPRMLGLLDWQNSLGTLVVNGVAHIVKCFVSIGCWSLS